MVLGQVEILVFTLAAIAVPSLALPFHHTDEMRMGEQFFHGISDERAFWSRFSSLQSELASGPRQWFNKRPAAKSIKHYTQTKTVCGWLGLGKALDPGTHMVDKCGLTDPLLARMPALHGPHWRIGHFERALPFGYLESLEDGSPLFDSELDVYAQRIALITRGELGDIERVKAIVRNNLSSAKLTGVLRDYRIDVAHLQARRESSRVVLFEPGAEDSDVLSMDGVSWRILNSTREAPSALQVRFGTPGRYKIVLEYADTKNQEQGKGNDREREDIDYVVAILREIEDTSVQLALPQKANLPNLVYVHVFPLGTVEGQRVVTLAFNN